MRRVWIFAAGLILAGCAANTAQQQRGYAKGINATEAERAAQQQAASAALMEFGLAVANSTPQPAYQPMQRPLRCQTTYNRGVGYTQCY
jgi:hypothetical protein